MHRSKPPCFWIYKISISTGYCCDPPWIITEKAGEKKKAVWKTCNLMLDFNLHDVNPAFPQLWSPCRAGWGHPGWVFRSGSSRRAAAQGTGCASCVKPLWYLLAWVTCSIVRGLSGANNVNLKWAVCNYLLFPLIYPYPYIQTFYFLKIMHKIFEIFGSTCR